jgi:chromosome segregation ATPase
VDCLQNQKHDLALQVQQKQSEVMNLKEVLGQLQEKESELNASLSQMTEKLQTLVSEHQAELLGLQHHMAEMKTEAAVKKEIFDGLNAELSEARNKLNIAELRLMNEVSSKDLQLKLLEDRLRKKTDECDQIVKSNLDQKKASIKHKDENKHLLAELERCKEDLKRCKDFEKTHSQERKVLQEKLTASEHSLTNSEREVIR